MKNDHRTALSSEEGVSMQVLRTTLHFCSTPSTTKHVLTLPFLPQVLNEASILIPQHQSLFQVETPEPGIILQVLSLFSGGKECTGRITKHQMQRASRN